MCASMADILSDVPLRNYSLTHSLIHSATAEIRRGKKEEEEKKDRTRMWANAQRDGRPA